MTIVKKIIVTYIPDKCVLCDFCVHGTHQDIDLGCEWVCVAGQLNRQGKERLTEEEVLSKRPDWCPLVVETPLNKYKNVAGDYDIEIGGTIPSIESEE